MSTRLLRPITFQISVLSSKGERYVFHPEKSDFIPENTVEPEDVIISYKEIEDVKEAASFALDAFYKRDPGAGRMEVETNKKIYLNKF